MDRAVNGVVASLEKGDAPHRKIGWTHKRVHVTSN